MIFLIRCPFGNVKVRLNIDNPLKYRQKITIDCRTTKKMKNVCALNGQLKISRNSIISKHQIIVFYKLPFHGAPAITFLIKMNLANTQVRK